MFPEEDVDEAVGITQPLRARTFFDEDGLFVEVDWIENNHSSLMILPDSGATGPLFAQDECTLVVRKAEAGNLVADLSIASDEKWTIPFVINDPTDWPEDWPN